jgi:Kef-type K+ transport system membrane component KefB
MVKKRDDKKAQEICTAERKRKGIGPLPLALIVCFALSSISAFLDLAAIIGAFLAGMAFAEFKDKWPCEEKIEPIAEFLTPFFFVFVGIEVSLAAFGEFDVLVMAGLITLLAVITKFVGCGLGAKSLGGKSASIIGVGMVPRGEVGLIVASIGLGMKDPVTGLGIIDPGLYNAIVFMSLVTTLIAPPLLTYTFRRKLGKKCELVPPDAE